MVSCSNNYEKNSSHQEIPDSSIKKGEELASIYCQSCHLLPNPSLLDTETWEEEVLPRMGPHPGIFKYNFRTYPANRNDIDLPRNFYPSQPLINNEQWQNIIDYYTAISPDSLKKRTDPI